MFVKVVILLMGLSTAYTLKCYNCQGKGCKTGAADCSILGPSYDRCAIVEYQGIVAKSCMTHELCVAPVICCSTDLCNDGVLAGPAV